MLEVDAMEQVRRVIGRVAPTSAGVVLCGGRGVGKSFLARVIHRLSERAGEFVTVNCDVPPDRIEGAVSAALAIANRGTVFFRQVDKLPVNIQATLATALERRAVHDVRFIFATRLDIPPPLAHRLGFVTIEIPPLAERRDEIPAIVNDFIEEFRTASGREVVPRITPDAMDRLCGYPWPGNVRQLKAVVERALVLCEGTEISTEHLTIEMSAPADLRRDVSEPSSAVEAELRRIVETLEIGPVRRDR